MCDLDVNESLCYTTFASLYAICYCLPDLTEGKAQLQLTCVTHEHCQLVMTDQLAGLRLGLDV